MADEPENRGGALGEPAQPETDEERPATQDDDEGDFADEHTDVTLADETAGGPEDQPEDDSPRGLAGAD